MYLGRILEMRQKIGDEALTIATVAAKVHQGMDLLWGLLSSTLRLPLYYKGKRKICLFIYLFLTRPRIRKEEL